MFHQLVMHGIGGRTIAQAKRNLSAFEVRRWVQYIEKNGSLDWGPRIEYGFALIAWLLANKVSGYVQTRGGCQPVGVMKKRNNQPYTIRDFMPHAGPEPEQDLSVEKFLAVLGGRQKNPKKRKSSKRKAAKE